MISTIGLLRQKNPQLAAQFASEIASKLINDKLLTKPEAALVLMNLLRFTQNSRKGATPNPILSDEQYRELLQKAVSDALSFSRPPSGTYSPERDAALNLLYGLRQLGPEINSVAGGSLATVQKKITELNPDNPNADKYRNLIRDNTFEAALEAIEKAPLDQREQLYIDLANREANNGEIVRAKQIVNERVTNPYQRRQALANIDNQETHRAASKGKIEDALRIIGSYKTARERAVHVAQIANQIGPGQKRA
ncbi:MAG TPA: hypothetical protein VK868_00635, partial [Pyrinomonadaceae bacterium]|nr:hypothetical protein [Pyrinomonadaceae bacterium]